MCNRKTREDILDISIEGGINLMPELMSILNDYQAVICIVPKRTQIWCDAAVKEIETLTDGVNIDPETHRYKGDLIDRFKALKQRGVK
jgi:hypothetical protein